MRDIIAVIKELFEHIWEDKKYWMIPVILAIIIVWLLLNTSSTTAVPVFVYPLA